MRLTIRKIWTFINFLLNNLTIGNHWLPELLFKVIELIELNFSSILFSLSSYLLHKNSITSLRCIFHKNDELLFLLDTQVILQTAWDHPYSALDHAAVIGDIKVIKI